MRLHSQLRVLLALLLCAGAAAAPAQTTDTYDVLQSYPHDTQAFTQGLVYLDGHLYESTGIKGQSSLRMEELETGRILQFQQVPDKYFAEGLTNWSSTLIQLTWETHLALVYDRATFQQLRTFSYTGEGWGLTQDGKSLILSDGTAQLRFLDPATFHELRRITVRDHGKPITQLNELEYIHGQVFANIWHSDRIARISPLDGHVISWIDCSGLLPDSEKVDAESVLNGIAYDAQHDRLFVTGKQWPLIFQILAVANVPKQSRNR